MKKTISTALFLIMATICSAQVKYTYCDVYVRGSWNNMNITIIHNNKVIMQTNGNISSAINAMADKGWVLEESIVIPRQGFPVTRHKLHFIMKKEWNVSESGEKAGSRTDQASKNDSKTPLHELFSSGKVALLNPKERREKERLFIAEIDYNLKHASTKQEMEMIRSKIETLQTYNSLLLTKNYDVIDSLNNFIYYFNMRAKKIGVEKIL